MRSEAICLRSGAICERSEALQFGRNPNDSAVGVSATGINPQLSPAGLMKELRLVGKEMSTFEDTKEDSSLATPASYGGNEGNEVMPMAVHFGRPDIAATFQSKKYLVGLVLWLTNDQVRFDFSFRDHCRLKRNELRGLGAFWGGNRRLKALSRRCVFK